MCNVNEVPPTPEEIKTITLGYKVFYDRWLDGKLQTPFFSHHVGKRWAKAEFSEYSGRGGFHVFISQKDADGYLNALTYSFATKEHLVVKKVLIKDIIAIGQTDTMAYGGDICPPHSVVRCHKIRIASDGNNQITPEEKK